MKFIDIPTEQTTAVTDVILALVAWGGLLYLRQIGERDPWKAGLWAWACGLLALAAGLGAVAHGFQMPEAVNEWFWRPLNLALGLVVALFLVGVIYDLWGRTQAEIALPVMLSVGVVFFGIVLLKPGNFLIFMVYEVAAMIFALGAYSWLAATGRLPGAGWLAAGVLVTIIAAGIQAGWDGKATPLTFIWQFDQNGLYHLVQMVGVIFLLVGLRGALLAI